MGNALKLEEFDLQAAKPLRFSGNSPVVTEEQKLESFEKGYKAGWDDAAKAQRDDKSRISADFERNLQGLSFTFHEARAQMLKDLRPLLSDMVSKVLPGLVERNLPEIVVGNILEIARTNLDTQIELVVAPNNRQAIETLLGQQDQLPLQITSEPSLGDGQVYLRFADSEIQFDLHAVTDQIGHAIDDFYTLHEKAG
ncbi:MAG: flagellar biosynthesis protein [Halocynthiibacter sp.]